MKKLFLKIALFLTLLHTSAMGQDFAKIAKSSHYSPARVQWALTNLVAKAAVEANQTNLDLELAQIALLTAKQGNASAALATNQLIVSQDRKNVNLLRLKSLSGGKAAVTAQLQTILSGGTTENKKIAIGMAKDMFGGKAATNSAFIKAATNILSQPVSATHIKSAEKLLSIIRNAHNVGALSDADFSRVLSSITNQATINLKTAPFIARTRGLLLSTNDLSETADPVENAIRFNVIMRNKKKPQLDSVYGQMLANKKDPDSANAWLRISHQ
jgi:hypothetical protein